MLSMRSPSSGLLSMTRRPNLYHPKVTRPPVPIIDDLPPLPMKSGGMIISRKIKNKFQK